MRWGLENRKNGPRWAVLTRHFDAGGDFLWEVWSAFLKKEGSEAGVNFKIDEEAAIFGGLEEAG